MAYTYKADVWCDTCGERIRAELTIAGTAPADPEDESSYDSDDFPKHYDAENDEVDGPQNCASGDCDGNDQTGRYGTFLETQLTPDGYSALQKMLDRDGATLPAYAQEWADFYQFEHYENPWSSAHEWLRDTAQAHASKVQDVDGANVHASALFEIVDSLAGRLDSDAIQDLYQSDMENDDYFKATGWYSPEMDG